MNQNTDLIKLISNEKKIEILRKNWISHDAKAQMAVVQEFGWEKGNKLNKAVIHEIGKVMMYRFKNALNITQVTNMEEFFNIASAAMNFYYPPPYSYYRFEKVSENEIMGMVDKCPIIENVQKLGVAEFYECGCFAMRSGWYKALGVDIQEECLSCIKDGDNECKIVLKVKNWNNKQ
ncbi:MAG: L-2-amino-thiazoline-4-carboxylic acid hydrolase [Promethearchaeota archaeon]